MPVVKVTKPVVAQIYIWVHFFTRSVFDAIFAMFLVS
jgi:hypothetical protein